jgi:hypothetical protein
MRPDLIVVLFLALVCSGGGALIWRDRSLTRRAIRSKIIRLVKANSHACSGRKRILQDAASCY